MAAIHYCRACGGEGRKYASRYGGNDPNVWDDGPCPQCGGSGDQGCEECAQGPATDEFIERGRTYLLCRGCADAWREDAAA